MEKICLHKTLKLKCAKNMKLICDKTAHVAPMSPKKNFGF
mgnify:CR=1 FL=1